VVKKKIKIKVKFLEDFGQAKKGEIAQTSEDEAKNLIDEGIAKYVEDPKKQIKKQKEAKFQRDKFVFNSPGSPNLNLPENKDVALSIGEIDPKNYDRLIGNKILLEDVHKIYKEELYLEDTKRIDMILASALSSKMNGIPIWLILVGASGDMKSVQLNALEGFDTYYLQKMTSKTLVNGFKDKEKHPDLAPKLNNKIMVIRDMATLMKLPPAEKAEIWGQLRDLYDGFAGTTSGMGTDVQYSDLKISLIAASTPSIDGQILIHQDLGTRELIYRCDGNKNKKEAMKICMRNQLLEDKIMPKLREVTVNFLKKTEINENLELDDKTKEELMEMAIYISLMRASADIDQYTNTLRTNVIPEEPTRVIKQLTRLFICFKSLDKNYPQDRAIEILWKLARSSAFQIRVNVLDTLIKLDKEVSTSNLADRIKIGKSTSQRELNTLWNMGLVKCRKEPTTFPDRTYDYWQLNRDHHFIKKLEVSLKKYFKTN